MKKRVDKEELPILSQTSLTHTKTTQDRKQIGKRQRKEKKKRNIEKKLTVDNKSMQTKIERRKKKTKAEGEKKEPKVITIIIIIRD